MAAYAAPPPRQRSGPVVFLLGVVFFLLCGASGATLAFIVHSGRSASSSMGAAPPGLGVPAQDGKFEFVVASVSCGHATVHQGPQSKSPQGQYCLVALTVANLGRQAQTFADAYQKAIGPTGTTYGTDTAAGVLVNAGGTGTWTPIAPGDRVSGTIVFDIPKDAVIDTLELHDSVFSRGVRVLAA